MNNKLLVTLRNPNSQLSEQFRKIRTNIEFSGIDNKLRIINVTSSVAGESKSTTACNLAIMFANKFNRILLVDADLRHPSVHRIMGTKIGTGLTDLVLEYSSNDADFSSIDLSKYIDTFDHPSISHRLDVLNVGSKVNNPAEFIGSKSFKAVLKELSKQYDYIIIDAAPAGLISDGLIVSSSVADGTIFVVQYGKTKYEVIKSTIKQLKNSGCNILGGIITRTPVWTDYYSHYYSSNYYMEEAKKDGKRK